MHGDDPVHRRTGRNSDDDDSDHNDSNHDDSDNDNSDDDDSDNDNSDDDNSGYNVAHYDESGKRGPQHGNDAEHGHGADAKSEHADVKSQWIELAR